MKKGIYLFLFILLLAPSFVFAANNSIPLPSISLGVKTAQNPQELSTGLQILFLITVLSLAPAIFMMLTSFTRIVIVLEFVGRALSLQQVPPRQVLVSLALFLTFFIMAPTFFEIYHDAFQPYMKGEITQIDAFKKSISSLRKFMILNTREKDIGLFVELSKMQQPQTIDDVPTYIIVPSFMLSELRSAFIMGIMIFLPFIMIDMIVASTLMSMGMIMLPPAIISLPIKIILFILADGWNLLAHSILNSYKLF